MGDAAVAHLVLQPPQRVVDDVVVVEGERRQVSGVEPRHVLCIEGQLGPFSQKRPIDDRHHTLGRPVHVSERVELFEVTGSESGGFGEGARGGVLEVFAVREPAARQGPAALVRVARAPHERQDDRHASPAGAAAQAEDHGRDRDADAVD